jgi:hypothetical protein
MNRRHVPMVEERTHTTEKPCCCCAAGTEQAELVQTPPITNKPWIVATLETPVGTVPCVSTELSLSDHLGAWRVRWGIGRMRYKVDPGLYAVGTPTADSPVLVSANYKMSFDRLRSQLAGHNAWLLVLDTRGVNVWCAAGKGTFGTDEIVGRVRANRLEEVVSHRTLVVPQLGAPGVAAHQVKNRCGFRVAYGPVMATDIPAFLAANMQATSEMRRVRFSLPNRIAVIPVELVHSAKWAFLFAACSMLLAGLGRDGYSWGRVAEIGTWSALMLLATWLGSMVFVPILLPWLPGRAFSIKGLCLGLVMLPILVGCLAGLQSAKENWLVLTAWCLIIPTSASFLAMGFTGSTTYTSLSGVRHEARLALPVQLVCIVFGVVIWVAGRFM